MRLNTLSPAHGSRPVRKRMGRGTGSGYGKTAGRGHNGQKCRSGCDLRIGFEGGQMPLQRRMPKSGFSSRVAPCAEVGLGRLDKLPEDQEVTLENLRAAKLVRRHTERAKIILRGECARAYVVSGVAVTRGARSAIEAAGGEIRG